MNVRLAKPQSLLLALLLAFALIVPIAMTTARSDAQQPMSTGRGAAIHRSATKATDAFPSAKISAAVGRYAAAESDRQRSDATDQVRDAVSEYFDQDMERRKKQLEEVRHRVTEMKSHLDKRTDMKSEIIELQLQSFTYDAEGLGLVAQAPKKATEARYVRRLATAVVELNRFHVEAELQTEVKQAERRVSESREKLKAAESEEDKTKARAELAEAMNGFFDQDMKRRREDLAGIEQRVTEMREYLEKRAAARDDIVDLHVKIFLKEAEGMGFYSKPEANDEPKARNAYGGPTSFGAYPLDTAGPARLKP